MAGPWAHPPAGPRRSCRSAQSAPAGIGHTAFTLWVPSATKAMLNWLVAKRHVPACRTDSPNSGKNAITSTTSSSATPDQPQGWLGAMSGMETPGGHHDHQPAEGAASEPARVVPGRTDGADRDGRGGHGDRAPTPVRGARARRGGSCRVAARASSEPGHAPSTPADQAAVSTPDVRRSWRRSRGLRPPQTPLSSSPCPTA